jgi:hypothetical protein
MAKTIPAVPDPTDAKSEKKDETNVKDLKRKKDEISKYEKSISDSVDRINKKIKETFKFACTIRLDMVSDQLQHLNPKWAEELDHIANEIEKSEWI